MVKMKLIKITRWVQLLKTSVRVFFVQRNGTKNVSRTVFNEIFLVLDTIFYRKSLELTKNYHQKLITPNGLVFNKYRFSEKLATN